ncbi:MULTISPECIES: ShlB/FhaC/HecB family hemolysin secretion/activation protein [Aerosakkonema]|uniref:ShlB/FhaC/HecB family hemolysin secretion/activation protein n=1 Tax=Aerosakkonema TaxID=1246629 RepID=UPI0035BB4CEA
MHSKNHTKNLKLKETNKTKEKQNLSLLPFAVVTGQTLGMLLPSNAASYLALSLVALIGSLYAEGLKAQTLTPNPSQVPNPVLPTPPTPPPLPPLPTPAPLPPPSELLQPSTPSNTAPTEPVPSDLPNTIKVERFEFDGNTALSDRELAEVTKPFLGDVSFAQLLQARSAVTQLYVSKGYITSGAFIPPQALNGGVVKIQVVEGVVEEIRVTGTGRLNANYVRSRVALGADKPLNVNRLLQSLQLLQLNPLIRNISAELSAGSRPGSSVLEVTVRPAPTEDLQITFDNGRSPSVGTLRRGAAFTEANLLGQGDALVLSYANTTGSHEFDASYTYPINARNGTLRFSFGYTKSSIIEEPFDQVDIEAASRDYELTYRQPIIQTPTQEFAVGVTASRRESKTFLLDEPFQLSPGADDEGRTRISAIRVFQEWTQRSSQSVFAARSQFNFGIGAFDASINESYPDSRFVGWRGQAQWLRLLGGRGRDTTNSPLLLLRADMQLADRALLPLEQFGLGGFESVRGYRQDALLTDNGVFASAEVRFPIYRLSEGRGLLQVIPFVDVGKVWNSSGRVNPETNNLASVGVGVQWQMGDRMRARIDYGIPLIDLGGEERTLQEKGLYFSLQFNPF